MKAMKLNASRKQVFRAGAILMLVFALVICQLNAPSGSAQTPIGVEFIFDVVPDTAPLSASLPTGTTFYLQGKVYPIRTVNQADCTFATSAPRQVGTWRAWGQVADDGKLVINQSIRIETISGMIEIQGTTGSVLGNGQASPAIFGTSGPPFTGPTEVLAVTGGAGIYRGLNGEAQIRPYCGQTPDPPFRYDRAFCIGIVEARRTR